ncbi:transmembrane emp24 domain-containing protein 7 [Biomphalaria glabrata]|uniref:Transmembrane emp24 domain-containing protein 7-like n=1 Tax=Biomphalaria glabrata TaxID=6526 RepID=A0A9U8EEE1_BIOGL|nr:transmembrane emp24 domain-containing protein 7-like [Biomphalaria glabrata]KAI8740752.1 transmembrane emp24 domain-containing protein 7-like [Biomphalaria glabrata]
MVKMFINWLIVSACCLTYVAAYITREAFVIIVPNKQKSCFSKSFSKSIKVIFEFRVTEGGNQDIDARIVSPNGLVIFKDLKSKGNEVSFNAQNGDFKFCFSNEFSQVTSKRVAFNIRPYDEASLSEESGGNKFPKAKSALEAFCDNIHFLMTTVMDFQMKYMVRESMGRYVAENLNRRVMWWSMGLSAVIVVTGFGQVFVFKKFFTERRSSTKPQALTT